MRDEHRELIFIFAHTPQCNISSLQSRARKLKFRRPLHHARPINCVLLRNLAVAAQLNALRNRRNLRMTGAIDEERTTEQGQFSPHWKLRRTAGGIGREASAFRVFAAESTQRFEISARLRSDG